MKNKTILAILLATISCLLWSGNYIVARGIATLVPPFALSFLRWSLASWVLLFFVSKNIKSQLAIAWQYKIYFLFTALFGVTFFNSLLYLAGHFTSAINLALIGSIASPIFSVVLAYFFLKEKLSWAMVLGMLLCVVGIIYLLSNGSLQNLAHLQFGKGDAIMMASAFCFAAYNVMVRKKPVGIQPLPFMFIVMSLGSVMMLPGCVWEMMHHQNVIWQPKLIGILLYVGIGASVVAYLFWNKSISILGASRTALVGNLIPIFSSIEAVVFLGEKITWLHSICAIIVLVGLVLANYVPSKKISQGK